MSKAKAKDTSSEAKAKDIKKFQDQGQGRDYFFKAKAKHI